MPSRRTRACALALFPLFALLAGAASAGAVTMSRTFDPIRAPQTFDVPAGVTSVDVEAIGGRGGFGGNAPGGYGARVTGRLTVTPGQRLWVMVGGNGAHARTFLTDGWNGGGRSGGTSDHYDAGDGGGASDVRVCAPDAATCEADDPRGRVLVAGGGGGAAGNAMNLSGESTAGADAGRAAADVATTVRGFAGGGGAGTGSTGGTAGASAGSFAPASAGALAVGGNGATGYDVSQHPGGGGGGGLYGGGGGGSTGWYGAGGGGGSNLVPPGGTASTDSTGTPRITVTWEVGAPATVDRPVLASSQILADGATTTRVTVVVRDADGAPVSGADVSFEATAPAPQIGAVTDHGDGTYSATLTASTTGGVSTVTARLAAPEQVSAGVALAQVARPLVTTPAEFAPAIAGFGSVERVTVAGTADPLTERVALYCVNRYHVLAFTDAAADIPVVDGAWRVEDARLPEAWLPSNHCKLVALPVGVDGAVARPLAGPRVGRMSIHNGGRRLDQTTLYMAEAGGLAGEAYVNALGYDCGVKIGPVDALLVPGTRWLQCGGTLTATATFDGRPDLTVDGRTALVGGLLPYTFGSSGLANLPRLTVRTAASADGGFVITERGKAVRCTATDGFPTTDPASCGTLVDTGVEVVVRTVIAPSGTQVKRSILFESADGAPHEARVVLSTRSGYTTPELRFGDETEWTQRVPAETVPVTGERYSVLLRDGADAARPATAVTAVPAPATQRVENGRFWQAFEQTVPAGGVAGVGLTFALADVTAVAGGAAATRESYDVAVAIDGPADGTTTDERTATLTGTASDGNGAAATDAVALRVGGEPVTVGDDGRWTATVALREGANQIEAVVQSPFGPRVADSVTVTYVPPVDPPEPRDPEPPEPRDPEPPTPPSPDPPTPPGLQPPTTGTTPTPAPPATRPPAAAPRLVQRLAAPKRARLAQARTRGIAIPLRLTTDRARVSAELGGPWGAFARVVRSRADRGRIVLRLKPSRAAAAKAARALSGGRRAVMLRLRLTVRGASGAAQTVTATVRLVR